LARKIYTEKETHKEDVDGRGNTKIDHRGIWWGGVDRINLALALVNTVMNIWVS
jgi:hypothetical protein